MSGRRLGFAGQVRAVWRKEFIDALRDRRSLMSALLYPILMPLMITVMFSALARLESADRPLETPIAGREHAPNLVAWLEERGVVVVDPPADPEAAVRDGDVDLVLVIDEEYGEQFRSVPAGRRPHRARQLQDHVTHQHRPHPQPAPRIQQPGGGAAPDRARRQPGGSGCRRPSPCYHVTVRTSSSVGRQWSRHVLNLSRCFDGLAVTVRGNTRPVGGRP